MGFGLGWLGDSPSQGLDLEDTNAGDDGTIVTMECVNVYGCIQEGCNLEELRRTVETIILGGEDVDNIIHHFHLEFIIIIRCVIAPKVIDS